MRDLIDLMNSDVIGRDLRRTPRRPLGSASGLADTVGSPYPVCSWRSVRRARRDQVVRPGDGRRRRRVRHRPRRVRPGPRRARGLGLPHAPPGPAGRSSTSTTTAGPPACASAPRSTWAPRASPRPTSAARQPTPAIRHRSDRGDATDDCAPPRNQKLLDWVEEWAAIFQPDARRVVRRLRRGVRPPVPAARRRRHVRAPRRRQAAQQLPRPLRPRRRRPGRGPHLHLLRAARSTPAPPTTGATRPR